MADPVEKPKRTRARNPAPPADPGGVAEHSMVGKLAAGAVEPPPVAIVDVPPGEEPDMIPEETAPRPVAVGLDLASMPPNTLLAVRVSRPDGRRPAHITLPNGHGVKVTAERPIGLLLTAAEVVKLTATYRDQIVVVADGVAEAPRNPLDLAPDPRTLRQRAAAEKGGKATLYAVALRAECLGATVKVPDGTKVLDVTGDTPVLVKQTKAQHATFLKDWGDLVEVSEAPDDAPEALPLDERGEVQLPPKVQSRRRRGGR